MSRFHRRLRKDLQNPSVRKAFKQEIRRLWDEGIQSGPGRFANADELIAEAERRFKEESGG